MKATKTPTETTTATSDTSAISKSSSSSLTTMGKKKKKMDISVNLKRRRDSGDLQMEEGDKKTLKKNTQIFTIPNSNTLGSRTKRKKNEISSSTPATRPNNPSPTTIKKNSLAHLTEFPLSPTSPSLLPISTAKLLSRPHSEARDYTPPVKSPTATKHRARSALNEVRHALYSFYFCQDILEPANIDHFLKKH